LARPFKKDKLKRALKYSIRILGWIVISALFLILLSSLLIQLKPVKDKIAEFAGKKVSQIVTGEFQIEEIQGDFFSNLKLKNISLQQESDTIFFLDNIIAKYDLLPLLRGKIQIYYLGINGPDLMMVQLNDSTWNINNIIKPVQKEKDKPGSVKISLALDTLELNDGYLDIVSPDTLIPENLDSINIAASFHLDEKNMNLSLNRFEFLSSEPDFKVENIRFILDKNEEFIQLSNLFIKTSGNRIEGRGDYLGDEPLEADATLNTAPVNTGEFEYFLGEMKLPVSPVIQFDADVSKDSLRLYLELRDENQVARLYAITPNFRTIFDNSSTSLTEYNITADLDSINLVSWTGNPSLKHIISGTLDITGVGFDPEKADINLDGRFNDCLIQERQVDTFTVNANLFDGDLDGKINASGEFGDLFLTASILELFNRPQYSLELTTREFNLAPVIGIDTLNSSLNIRLKAKGESFEPEKIKASASIMASNSYLQELELDTLLGQFQYQNENLVVEQLFLELQSLDLDIEGNYHQNGRSDMTVKLDFEDLSGFDYYIPVSKIDGQGKVIAHLYGYSDSLRLDTDIDLKDIDFQGNTAKSITISANGYLGANDTLANIQVSAEEILAGEFSIESLTASIEASPDDYSVETEINTDELNTLLTANLQPGDTITTVLLKKWEITYNDQQWNLQEPPASLAFDSLNYHLENFYLSSGTSDTAQVLKAHGTISRQGEENLSLQISNLPVSQILLLTDREMNASGMVNLDLSVKGNAAEPIVESNIRIDSAGFNENSFTEFAIKLAYDRGQLKADASIIHRDSGFIELSAGLPFYAALDSMKFSLSKDEQLSGKLRIQKFPLKIIQTLDQIEEMDGYIDGNIDLGGTLNSLNPAGELQLIEGTLKIPQYGIDYPEIAMDLSLGENSAELDSILIRSEDGKLTGSGKMTFSSEIYKGDLSETRISVKLSEFNPVNHPQFNMQLNGNIDIEGKEKNLVFDGDISIPEAEVFIPAVMNMMGQSTVPELPQPILLREMREDSITTDSLRSFVFRDTIENDTARSEYFDNIEGSVNVNIPRNVWIKNEDMYVEIMGDVELIKNPEFFEIFGALDVVRGQYSLLSKTFIIEKGTISFQGGEELTPLLDIEASYTFRNTQRVEQTLRVFVRGDTELPQISFRLDGKEISEGDALSYIMFGKSMNELSMGQQNNVAEKAAANLISSQLSGYLSEKLDVDYIEVKADEGFENATVIVGKYITNDLFISYEQRLGETDEQEISNYQVRLEYELFRFLFLELNNSSMESGFDLIFKKDFD
jgi:translocation and assembly module TamB